MNANSSILHDVFYQLGSEEWKLCYIHEKCNCKRYQCKDYLECLLDNGLHLVTFLHAVVKRMTQSVRFDCITMVSARWINRMRCELLLNPDCVNNETFVECPFNPYFKKHH